MRRGNLGGRVGVGDLTPLLHQRKPGAARNGAARFLAMVLGHIALEHARDKRLKVDDEVADAPIGQDVGNRLEQRRLGRIQVQIAQADGSAANHAGIGVLAAHGVADQTRFTPGQQLARLVQRKELNLAAADSARLAAIGKDSHPCAHTARGRPRRTGHYHQLARLVSTQGGKRRIHHIELFHCRLLSSKDIGEHSKRLEHAAADRCRLVRNIVDIVASPRGSTSAHLKPSVTRTPFAKSPRRQPSICVHMGVSPA
mgnify:CR=1 FL=1